MARCTWLKTYPLRLAEASAYALNIQNSFKVCRLLNRAGAQVLHHSIRAFNSWNSWVHNPACIHNETCACFGQVLSARKMLLPESWCHNINRPVYHRSAGSCFNTFCLFFKTMLDNSWLNLKSTKLFESVIWICSWFQNRICDIISIRGVGNDPNFQANIWHIWHLWTTRWFKLQHHLVNCSDHVCSNFTASQVIGQWMPIQSSDSHSEWTLPDRQWKSIMDGVAFSLHR